MFRRKLPVEFRAREPTIAPWDGLGYEREAVKHVLSMLSRAFGWSVDEGLRLRPEDQVWEIYWGYYPAHSPHAPKWRRWIGWPPDSLEIETLDRDLRKAAPAGRAVNLHVKITVRELVDLLMTSRSTPAPVLVGHPKRRQPAKRQSQ